ncbi:type II toxin-antitoxin system ParD family antitoxin [Lyngbya sp. CCAP 1446/10]|nr:type II toxin-antitoxin system ParD family antitoxin [Lyngbya sp. CCAP 1446/10]
MQTKLETGKYRSAQEVLEVALRLLDEIRAIGNGSNLYELK